MNYRTLITEQFVISLFYEQKELFKLDALGVFYRVPTVGAKIIEGQLHLNSSLLGLPLEYQNSAEKWPK